MENRAYPDEAVATTSKGKREVRVLLEKGEYLRYTYVNPEDGRVVRQGKESVILKSGGKRTKIFLIPLKDRRRLATIKDDCGEVVVSDKEKRVIRF